MQILDRAEDQGYEVLCDDCGYQFESGPVGLAFECPACGSCALAADLVGEWMLGRVNGTAAESVG